MKLFGGRARFASPHELVEFQTGGFGRLRRPLRRRRHSRAADVLRDESYKVTGSAPIYEILHTAKERAHSAGAKNVELGPGLSESTQTQGFHLMLKAGIRYGDAADMAVIELIDRDQGAKGLDSGPVQVREEDETEE